MTPVVPFDQRRAVAAKMRVSLQDAQRADVVDIDVEAVAERLRMAYVEAFNDVVTIALRCARTGERRRLEGNLELHRASNILERIRAEGHIARLLRHAHRIAPDSRVRQLARVRQAITNSEDFERFYQATQRTCDGADAEHKGRGLTMSGRIDDVFHVLKVIRKILDVEQEGIVPAIEQAERDRAYVKQLRNAISVRGPASVEPLETLHTICQFVISERETLGKALASIRRELDLVQIEPRTQNLGEGARGTDPPPKKGAPS